MNCKCVKENASCDCKSTCSKKGTSNKEKTCAKSAELKCKDGSCENKKVECSSKSDCNKNCDLKECCYPNQDCKSCDEKCKEKCDSLIGCETKKNANVATVNVIQLKVA